MLKGIWDVAMSPVLWLLYLLIALGVVNVGCVSIPLAPIVDSLKSPEVLATLQTYGAEAEADNPEIEVGAKIVYFARVVGVRGKGHLSGDRSGGIDPALYVKVKDAQKPPASQPIP